MTDGRDTFTTSQLADAAAVGPQTLRYYERRGLLPEPPRTPGGHRIYGRDHLRRLLFIQRAQSLGFDLQEIHGMLTLRVGAGGFPTEEGAFVDGLIATIDGKLLALRAMRDSLEEARRAPASDPPAGTRPLAALLTEPT